MQQRTQHELRAQWPIEQPDFGFRTLEMHLADYDLFRDYAPCWDGSETNAHITAFYQRNPEAA